MIDTNNPETLRSIISAYVDETGESWEQGESIMPVLRWHEETYPEDYEEVD